MKFIKPTLTFANILTAAVCLFACTSLVFAQPANDNCANATPITAVAPPCIAGNNTLATIETFEAGTGAAGVGCWVAPPDNTVWYSFTAPATASYTFGTSSSNADTQIKILAGTCGSFSLVSCNEDAVGLAAQTTALLNNGVTYYIQIDMFDAPGAFCLGVDSSSVAPPPPGPVANNDCIFGATDITADVNTIDPINNPFDCKVELYSSGANTPTNSDVNGNATACDGRADKRDRWFMFTVGPSTPNIWIDVYRIGTIDYTSGLYSGTPGGTCDTPTGLTLIDCSDGVTAGGARDKGAGTTPVHCRIDCGNLPFGTYYYRVWEWGGGAPTNGNFSLCIESGIPIGVTTDRCPDTATVALTCGLPNTNVQEFYPRMSNAGTEGNSENTNLNEPQVIAGSSGEFQDNCVPPWYTTIAYANNVINNTAIYAFDVNASGTCTARTAIHFENMEYGGTPGNVCQITVMNNACAQGASAIMTASTNLPCLSMRPVANQGIGNGRYYIVVDGQDGQLIQYDLRIDLNYTGPGCVNNTGQPSQPIGTGDTTCGPGTVTLNATAAGTITWYTAAFGGTSIATGPNYTTPVITRGTAFYATNTIGTCESARTLVYATYFNLPVATSPIYACNVAGTEYTASFDVSGGGGGTYTFNEVQPGSIGGDFVSGTYTTYEIPSGTPFEIEIMDDVTGCGPLTVVGNRSCNCITNAGTMNIAKKFTCGPGAITATHNASTASFDPNDVLEFILHDNAGAALGTVLQRSLTPTFSFGGGTVYNTEYYISAVVGNNDGTGIVDFSDACLSVAAGTPLEWNQNPSPTASAVSTQVCEGTSIDLLGSNANPATYSWTGPAGYTENEQNPSRRNVTPAMSGDYIVTAVVNGCTATSTVNIIVDPAPDATIATPTGNPFCINGAAVNLTGASPSGTWSGNGITDPALGTFDPATAGVGVHTITYSVAGSCPGTDTEDLTVNAVPVPSYTADPTSGCSPLLVNFVNTTPNATAITWDFGNGNTSNANTVSSTYSAGLFDLTMTVTENGCVATQTFTNAIDSYQSPTALFVASDLGNKDFNFENNSIGGVSYFWEFGDDSTSVEMNPSHSFEGREGNVEVTLTVTSALGCTSTLTITIEIEEEVLYFIPNSFTPDGNQINNTFQPIMSAGFDPQSFEIRIFNKWGELIFESKDHTIGWDGTYDNKVVPAGAYFWSLRFRDLKTDQKYTRKGHIQVLI